MALLLTPYHPIWSSWSAFVALFSAPCFRQEKLSKHSFSDPTFWNTLPTFSSNCLHLKPANVASEPIFFKIACIIKRTILPQFFIHALNSFSWYHLFSDAYVSCMVDCCLSCVAYWAWSGTCTFHIQSSSSEYDMSHLANHMSNEF